MSTRIFLKRSTMPFKQNLDGLKRFFKNFLRSPVLPQITKSPKSLDKPFGHILYKISRSCKKIQCG